LATQIWEVDPERGRLIVFDGSYTEYKAAREAQAEAEKQDALQAEAQETKIQAATRPFRGVNTNKERQRRQKLVDLEAEVAELESQLELITKKLENPPADAGQVSKLALEYERLQSALEQRLDEWAHLSEELQFGLC